MTSSRIKSQGRFAPELQRLQAVHRMYWSVTLPAQILLQAEREIGFVFDNEDASHAVHAVS
jgi:hypothetical protein